MDIEAQIIGHLNGDPCSLDEIIEEPEFSHCEKGEVGFALENLLEEKMVVKNNEGQFEITDKAKQAYHL